MTKTINMLQRKCCWQRLRIKGTLEDIYDIEITKDKLLETDPSLERPVTIHQDRKDVDSFIKLYYKKGANTHCLICSG